MTLKPATPRLSALEGREVFVGHELREPVVRVAVALGQLGALRGGDEVAAAGERDTATIGPRHRTPRSTIGKRFSSLRRKWFRVRRIPRPRLGSPGCTSRAHVVAELERRDAEERASRSRKAAAVGDDAFVGEHRDVLGSEEVLVLAHERVVLVVTEVELHRLPRVGRPERRDAAG